MIRQAERYYIDCNMLLKLPPFVGFVFTPTDLAKATKLSHIVVKKSHIDTLAFGINEIVPPVTSDETTEENKPSVNV